MTTSTSSDRLPRTPTEQVLEHLRTRGPLTQLEALRRRGCLRLGARIWDLKQRDYRIETDLIELSSGQRVARYSLVRELRRSAAIGTVA
jgi:hypothetical protein